MTWVAWRVQRLQLLAAIAGVVALVIWLSATGLAMGHNQTWKYWTNGDTYVLYALPGLLGLAIGSPLVASEIEHSTNRLAWSQSVTRTRWIASKLLVGGVFTIALTALLTLVLEWWTGAVSLAASTNSGGFSGVRIQPSTFDLTGLVVVAYALFAYFLGAALGALLRRPGWAFAAGIPIFIFVRLAIREWVRPSLVAPKTVSSLSGFPFRTITNSWLLNAGILPTGRSVPVAGQTWTLRPPAQLSSCIEAVKAQTSASFDAAQARCASLAHVHYVIQFQPANHYWALQGTESAIFLAMALLLLAVTVFAVRAWRA